MRSIKSYIAGLFLTSCFSLLSSTSHAQLFQEISQTVRITLTVVEAIQVGPCSFDPNQICTNEDTDDSFGLGSFGLRVIAPSERPFMTRALASIASLLDYKVPKLPIMEQPTAQVWDKRL
jgi:hypothetical protein